MPSTAPQPSFIPGDAKQAIDHRRHRGGLAELLMLIGIVLFVASGALAGGVFFYGQYLNGSNTNKLAQLTRARDQFQPALVQQLQRLDDRMNSSNGLLQAHLAPLALFTMLEQTTITNIQFTALTFDATDMQHIALKMNGVADSVNSVALQSDLFAKSGAIQNPIFSNIDRQPDGVHFDFTGLVNPVSLNYTQLLAGQAASNQIPIQVPSQQGTSTQAASQQGNPNPFTSPKGATPPAATSTTSH
jgi:hypothetical protein